MLEQIKEISETLNLPFETQIEANCCSSRVIKDLKSQLQSLEDERRKHLAVFIQGMHSYAQNKWHNKPYEKLKYPFS